MMKINIEMKKIVPIFLLFAFLFSSFSFRAKAEEATDFDFYQKYDLYLKYQKKEKYEKYEKYKKYKKKYGFDSSEKKFEAKAGYAEYKRLGKDKVRYPELYKLYKKYKKYKKYYSPYKKYSRYKKYEDYDRSEYNEGKNYGGAAYLAGYNRYRAALSNLSATVGEANLVAGALGPDISVGIYSYSRDDLRNSDLDVLANKDYIIKNADGNQVGGTISGTTETNVAYISDKNFNVHGSIDNTTVYHDVHFEAANEEDADTIIFDINRPGSSFDQYRGKLNLHYVDADNSVWMINTLPMEQYVWGMGEMAGTGPVEHSKVMTTIFRTYGYWKVKFSTKYAAYGFKVTADSSSQIYYGYDWEETHAGIKTAAEATVGQIIMYANTATGLNEVTITPYSSWTDGRTRSFQERWNSTLYPWCQSVADPYGDYNGDYWDNSYKSTAELEAAGNHMVGLSAHGSLSLATSGWDWDDILKHYFTGINLRPAYPYPSP